MEKLTEILKDLEQGKISADHAEAQILDLLDKKDDMNKIKDSFFVEFNQRSWINKNTCDLIWKFFLPHITKN